MNWEQILQWYLKKEISEELKELPKVSLRPDLQDIKLLYNMRGHLNLGDVKPAGLLIQSRA